MSGKEPIALELADLDATSNRRSSISRRLVLHVRTTYTHEALHRSANGNWEPHLFDGKLSVALELKSTPSRIQRLDIINDGRPEFMLFGGSDKAPALFTLDEKGVPKELKTEGGIPARQRAAGGCLLRTTARPGAAGRSGQICPQHAVRRNDSRLAGRGSVQFGRSPCQDGRSGHDQSRWAAGERDRADRRRCGRS